MRGREKRFGNLYKGDRAAIPPPPEGGGILAAHQMTPEFKEALLEKAKTAPKNTWLILFPASGKVRRLHGALLHVDVGGEARWTPFIVSLSQRVAMAVDPRALIVNHDTLEVAYNPRHHLDRIQEAARDWFKLNPHVFNPDTPSGFSYMGEI